MKSLKEIFFPSWLSPLNRFFCIAISLVFIFVLRFSFGWLRNSPPIMVWCYGLAVGVLLSIAAALFRESQLFESIRREQENSREKEILYEKLKTAQMQMEDAKRKAEEANHLKSLFLAHMSHEIRTPLVSVLGFADLLQEPDLSLENAAKYGSIIERTGGNLLQIINDILDLSKVEAGHLEIEHIPFSINLIIAELQSIFSPLCQQKSVHLQFQPENEIPPLIVSDPTRLRQILLNLVGNATKFTEKGYVRVRYGAYGHTLYFLVEDSGIGIEPDQHQRLFESFHQANPTIPRRYAGTGLGLSLSKKLANKLKGDVILIESQPGHGSTFQLKIDFERPTMSELQNEIQRQLLPQQELALVENKNILLVDDSVDNQFLIQTILSKWGLQVSLASNGKEALERVKKESFDLILMDMQMPIMDGYTACTHLKNEACTVPIVALTANAMKEDRERCLQAGCRDYLSKPIQRNQLFRVIHKNLTTTSV